MQKESEDVETDPAFDDAMVMEEEHFEGDGGPPLVTRRSCLAPRGNDDDWLRSNVFQSTCIIGGHSKEYCEEGTTDRNEESQAAEEQNLDSRNNVNEGERESYGPWMQVSYGRGNRSHLGYNATGRKSGNQGKSGRQGYSERQGNGTDMVGINRNGIHEENKKGADSGKNLMVETTPKKSGKSSHSAVVGSRFAILNENMDEEFNLESKQGKASSSKVLTEIYNRNPPSKSQLNPIANKYLVDSPSVKRNFSKPFKENGREVWSKKTRKGDKKNSQSLISAQTKPSEEEIEDSEVLQNLYKKMVEIRVAESHPFPSSEHPPSDEMLTAEHGQQQVVVAVDSTFEVVSSKLKEAMEIVLE
ncbi:hypothetical protein LWI29_023475 [Acer saccharum]|uniref:Uncharacterized protein n=1 Tax=Acer saccharum TaxID=4024 RepID=A0AA39TV35_ACESA|nr:hypothetical protein LWI29_023475 [Acer saccharum]